MGADIAPRRPIVRYHGGKWRLAPWIISYFPAHRVYVEPFGGGASVLLRKPRSYAEIYNDLDREIVNLFRVARDHGEELRQLLELTPFARDEFELSYKPSENPIEQARRTVARAFMGFGSNAHNKPTGFRANSNRSGTTPAHDWGNYPDCLNHIIKRLRGVVIENRDASDVMRHQDSPETLHYVDPPYVMESRADSMADYRYELTDTQHLELAQTLHELKGMVVLSGYPSELYQSAYDDWERVECAALADGAKRRTECLWLNPAVTAALNADIFGGETAHAL